MDVSNGNNIDVVSLGKKSTDAGLEHAISSSAIPETGALPLSQPALLQLFIESILNRKQLFSFFSAPLTPLVAVGSIKTVVKISILIK